MVWWILLLIWTASAVAQTPATLRSRVGSEYLAVYEATDRSKSQVPIPAEDYDRLKSPGTVEPDTKPPADGKTYTWTSAMEMPVYDTGSGRLEPGDVSLEAQVIFVALSAGLLCELDRQFYTLDDKALTISPNPPGFTLIEGVLTMTNATTARNGC